MPRRALHRRVFLAAGVYNVLWGLYTALDPQWVFRLAGMEPLNHPGVFACLAMVIGLYGVLYLEVARVPERGWLVAAVGLAGKVLGPLGMVALVLAGTWRPAAMLVCLTNDLAWWIPFWRYLRDAWPEFRRGLRPEGAPAWLVFGEPRGLRAPRPGAYAVVRDGSGRVAVVGEGRLRMLPGGGQDPEEPPEDALRREVREECGFEVAPGRLLGRAYQHLDVAPYFKQALFYEATPLPGPRGAAGWNVVWLDPEEAVASLYEESQAWAVVQALGGDPGWRRQPLA